MNTYLISCSRTYYGGYYVEAESKKEAEIKVNELLWRGVEMDKTSDPKIVIIAIEEWDMSLNRRKLKP